MTTLVPGDPGSLSAAGALLVRTAAVLSSDASELRDAYADLGRQWGGPRSVALRRRADLLVAAGEELAATFHRVGTALQEHATDLAELAARARAATERARLEGLEVRDGRVELGYGVRGEASAELAARREERRAGLQAELDVVRTQLARRRARLLAVLAATGPGLTAAATALRLL